FNGDLIHGALGVWDVRSRTERTHWPVDINSDFPSGLAFSPDGKLLTVTGDIGSAGRGNVQVWDVASGRVLDKQPPVQVGDAGAVTFASDGHTIAWATQGRVVLWNVVLG